MGNRIMPRGFGAARDKRRLDFPAGAQVEKVLALIKGLPRDVIPQSRVLLRVRHRKGGRREHLLIADGQAARELLDFWGADRTGLPHFDATSGIRRACGYNAKKAAGIEFYTRTMGHTDILRPASALKPS